jgi:hypothetical protein
VNVFPEVCPDSAPSTDHPAPEAEDLIGIIVRHAFFEEEIIRRIAEAVALGDKEAVFALAVELVGKRNE